MMTGIVFTNRSTGPISTLFTLLALLGQWLQRSFCLAGLAGLAGFGLFALPAPLAAKEHFPLYPSIRANVAFWEDIYSRYTTRQAVLHDSVDLNRVYTVVELVDRKAPMASRINDLRISQAKDKIAALFDALALGTAPRTREERRIAQFFAGQPKSAYRKAKDTLRVQIGQKDRFYEGVIRSGRYMPYIRSVLAAEQLPLELAYLPHVESSFHPRAGSKAGAYGLWQFTRGTGQQYMTINSLVDERFDPYVSTRAAVQFLKQNYAVLGTWPLAMTAYNYGRAGMVRAVRAHGTYEEIFRDYSQGYFKFASRNFYSEFLAAVRVAKRLESSGLVMDSPDKTHTYRLQEEVAFNRLRAKHQLEHAEFIRLNPALQKPVLAGERKVPKNYLVRVPVINNLQQQAKKAHPSAKLRAPQLVTTPKTRLPATSRQEKRPGYFHYTVTQGDTLSAIAQRFGVSKETILVANNKGPHNPVRVGDRLVLPGKRQQ